MINYYEMTAHACATVHVPGVAWPEYVAELDGIAPFKKRKPHTIKAQIIDLLKDGRHYTSPQIRSQIGGPKSSMQTILYQLRVQKIISAEFRNTGKGKPMYFYSMGVACKLH